MTLSAAMESRLRALSERCMSRAAISLGAMLGAPLQLRVAEISSLPLEALPELAVEENGKRLVTIQLEMTGEEAGFLLVVFPFQTVHRLLRRLLPASPDSKILSSLERSAVQEVANILASAFLVELGNLVGRRILPSPPQMQLEDADALLRQIRDGLRQGGEELVVVEAVLEDPEDHFEGRFFVFPEMASVARMTQAEE